jgi:hypothetical protein
LVFYDTNKIAHKVLKLEFWSVFGCNFPILTVLIDFRFCLFYHQILLQSKKKFVFNFQTLHLLQVNIKNKIIINMFWTLELASHLEEAPWPATKDELIDYAIRSGAPLEVVENLQELDDEGEVYEGVEDIWPDYPTQEDFFFNEDEY